MFYKYGVGFNNYYLTIVVWNTFPLILIKNINSSFQDVKIALQGICVVY